MPIIGSCFRRSSVALAVAAALACCHAYAADVLVYNAVNATTDTTLAARLTAAGNTPTIIASSGSLPGALSNFKQVWDLGATLALTTPQQSAYLNYLQGGGALFLMGENTSYGAARNATLITFIQAAGGGTVTISSSLDAQTVNTGVMPLPGGATTVTYPTAGGYTTTGTGTCLTMDGNRACSAIAFKVGSLANATKGSLVSVLDVNFLESSRISNFQGFIDGLISFVSAQAAISAGGGQTSSGQTISGLVPRANDASAGAAKVLDQLTTASTIDARMASTIGTLLAMPAAAQSSSLQRIAPETGQVQTVAATKIVGAAMDTMQARMGGLRTTSGLTIGMADDLDNGKLMLAANGDTSGLLTVATKKYGTWGKIFGSHGNQDMQGNYAGYTANSRGLAYGMDTLLRNGWVVGGAFSYADTSISMNDFRSGDSSKINTYQLSAYATRDFDKWYLESILSYAWQKTKGNRDTAVAGIASSNYNSQQAAARLTAGLPIALNEKWTVTPTAGLEYTYLNQDGYQETGGGPLGLTINGQSANRVRSVIGSALATQFQTSGGITITPSVHANWRYEFNNSGVDSTATFTGGGAAFKTPGQTLSRNTMNLGTSISFQKSKDFVLSVQLDGEKASGYSSVAGQVTGQWRF